MEAEICRSTRVLHWPQRAHGPHGCRANQGLCLWWLWGWGHLQSSSVFVSICLFKGICAGLQSVSSVWSERRAASGLYVLSASIVVGTWALLHFSAATQSFGSLQFLPWEEKRLSLHGCVYFALEPTQESLQPPSACVSALIHISSQVSDAFNLYSHWLHNYILDQSGCTWQYFGHANICVLLFLSVSHIFREIFWCLINIDAI